MFRAIDQQTLQRSTDSGSTWTRVFNDDATSVPAPDLCFPTCTYQFAASSLRVAADGAVRLSEWGNGDGEVGSDDGGASWKLLDGGLEGSRVVFSVGAPGDSRVMYAVAATAETTVPPILAPTAPPYSLYATDDGGATWTAMSVPNAVQPAAAQPSPSMSLDIAVDPADAHHLWAAWPTAPVASASSITSGSVGGFAWDLFESIDGAQSWTDRGSLPSLASGGIAQLTVIRSTLHSLRLAVTGDFGTFPSAVALSDTDGALWFPSPVPATGARIAHIGVASGRPDVVTVVVDNAGIYRPPGIYSSQDGLDSASRATAPGWLPCGTSSTCSLVTGDALPADATAVGVDQRGVAYFSVSIFCSATAPPACPTRSVHRNLFVRFAPAQQPGSLRSPSLTPAGPPPPSQPMIELSSCTVPPFPDPNSLATPSGSAAFDGHELMYANTFEQVGSTADGGAIGVIHTLDPGKPGCPSAGDIPVTVPAAEIARWLSGNPDIRNSPGPQTIWVGDMTYDQNRNMIWATLGQRDGGSDGNDVGVFIISVVRQPSGARTGTAHLAFMNGCGAALSYDRVRDRLWTCDDSQPTRGYSGTPSELAPADGSVIPSCAPSIGSDIAVGTSGAPTSDSGMATWTHVGPTLLYKQLEDDQTVEAYDTETCTRVARFVHRVFNEPSAEDEQMTCDSLTFGPGSAALPAGVQPGTVVWLRDAQASVISSYLVPGGACPEPTATTYVGPPRVAPGATVRLCSTLQQVYPGGTTPLAGMPLALSLDGPVSRTIPLPLTQPNAAEACVEWAADVPPGHYQVTAKFDPGLAIPSRITEYLPSAASGQLDVGAAPSAAVFIRSAGLPRAGLVVPGEPPSAPPLSQPGSLSQGQAAEQLQAQIQGQAQSQSQAQSAAQAQPAFMVQQRRQVQVVTQSAAADVQTSTHLATRRESPGSVAAEVVVASLLLGLGLMVRRPASAYARLRRPRR